MYPGDILFGDYEEELSGAWVECLAGRERGFRILTAIYRIVHERPVDFIFFDLGPNLGSLTRSLLLSSDYFISPMIPDAFSIRATENFGRKLRDWSILWQDALSRTPSLPFPVPRGQPKFVGYITQMFNIYRQKSTKFWQPWINKLPIAIEENVVKILEDVNGAKMVVKRDGGYEIGEIKNLSSLIPLAQTHKKPIQELPGLQGTQYDNALAFNENIRRIAKEVDSLTSP